MKVAVISDPHLKCEGNKRDEGTGLNARFLDRVKSLRWAVNDARERGCEYLLFGGDLFDSPHPRPYQIMAAIRAFQAKGDMKLIGIPGNHDMPRSANEDTALGPVFTAFDAALSYQPEFIDCGPFSLVTLPYPRRAQLAAALPNYSERAPEAADKLLAAMLIDILRGLHAQCDKSKPSVLLAHTSIDVSEIHGSIMAERDICLPIRQIPEFTVAAFGHIHAHQDFSKYDRPEIFHVGGTDRADFGEEGDAKHYVVIDTEKPRWELFEIPCREYRTFRVDFQDNGMDGFRSGFAPNPAEAKDAICRIKLKRPEHVRPDLADLERAVRSAGCFDFYGIEQEVVREATVRSEAIKTAQTTADLLGVWHSAKDAKVPLAELLVAAAELEGVTT
jgi:DNA repair exonuclease SbcCD nuclease subunit